MATKFYFRLAAPSVSGTLPSGEQATATAAFSATGSGTIKGLDLSPGTSFATISGTSSATTAAQDGYFGMFMSEPLPAATLGGGSIVLNIADRESNAASNFWINSINAYIWRPSTGTKVGTIRDSSGTSLGGTEGGTGYTVTHITGITSSAVTAQAGDVLIVEVWARFTQSMGSNYTVDLGYDGTTENTTENASVTNHASYIEFTENLLFPIEGTFNVTEPSDSTSVSVDVVASGTFDAVESNDTTSVSVDVLASGSLTTTEANDTFAALAEVFLTPAIVTFNVTEAADTLSASSVSLVSLSVNVTEATDTTSISVTVLSQSTFAATEAEDVTSINVSSVATASFTSTEPSDTVSIEAMRLVNITLGIAEANDTLDASALVVTNLSVGLVETNDTASASTNVLVSTNLSATEAADVLSANASALVFASLTTTESPDIVDIQISVPKELTFDVVEGSDTAFIRVLLVYPIPGYTPSHITYNISAKYFALAPIHEVPVFVPTRPFTTFVLTSRTYNFNTGIHYYTYEIPTRNISFTSSSRSYAFEASGE